MAGVLAVFTVVVALTAFTGLTPATAADVARTTFIVLLVATAVVVTFGLSRAMYLRAAEQFESEELEEQKERCVSPVSRNVESWRREHASCRFTDEADGAGGATKSRQDDLA